MADIEQIHEKLSEWLTDVMGRKDHRSTTRIELYYIYGEQSSRDTLKAWERAAATDADLFTDEPNRVNHLANTIIELAEYRTTGYAIGTRHRFKVVAHFALGGSRLAHSFVLPTEAEQETSTEGIVPANPTQTDVTALLMRHLENQQKLNKDLMQGFMGAANTMAATLRGDNEKLHAQVAQLMAERSEIIQKSEEAKSVEHKHQIEALEATTKAENAKLWGKKISGLLSVGVSEFIEERKAAREAENDGGGKGKTGKDGKPVKWKPSPLSVALGELAAGLDDDQETAIRMVLSVEQQIMFAKAIELAKKGGGKMLAQIVFDLLDTIDRKQLEAILPKLSPAQQQAFLKASQLAKAEVDPSPTSPSSPSNGASNGAQPDSADAAQKES